MNWERKTRAKKIKKVSGCLGRKEQTEKIKRKTRDPKFAFR